MMEASWSLSPQYGLDTDVMLTGCLVHDIAKIYELEEIPGEGYTAIGRLNGHIAMGQSMWDSVRCADRTFHRHVRHLILSHHGKLEWGSPVEPATAEAHALHLLDMIDSRLCMLRQIEGTEEGRFIHNLGWSVDMATKQENDIS